MRLPMTAAHVSAGDERVRFVTLDAYTAAGGGVIADLFQPQNEDYLTDPALLDRLVNDKLERKAANVREEGWKWVEIIPSLAYDTLHSYGRTQGKRQALPAKQAKALAKAEKQRDELAAVDQLTDEEAERYDALEDEIEALELAQLVWSDRQKAKSGVVIGIHRGGKLEIARGLIRPADIKAVKQAAEKEAAGDPPPLPAAPGLSAKLADDLTAHRTLALRALLAEAGHGFGGNGAGAGVADYPERKCLSVQEAS
jgi:ParB family chromosome partitioning protein